MTVAWVLSSFCNVCSCLMRPWLSASRLLRSAFSLSVPALPYFDSETTYCMLTKPILTSAGNGTGAGAGGFAVCGAGGGVGFWPAGGGMVGGGTVCANAAGATKRVMSTAIENRFIGLCTLTGEP